MTDLTPEQEQAAIDAFDDWWSISPDDAWSRHAWRACWKHRQQEIDALKKQVTQLAVRNKELDDQLARESGAF